MGVADERRHRQFLRRARLVEQLQAGFVRQAVALAGVHLLARPHEVFPRVRAAARAGHDVVEAAFVRAQQRAGVLAAVAVALADVLRAELRALLRHLGVVHRHDDRRHADRAAHGVHGVVAVANRQRDPLVPSDGTECFRTGIFAFDFERGGDVRRHLAERILRRANVDRLPVAVQHQHDCLVQYVAHKNMHTATAFRGEVFVLY